MNERALRRILNRVLVASLSVPMAAGLAACGGKAIESTPQEDAGPVPDANDRDTSQPDASPQSCEGQSCGVSQPCPPSCTLSAVCVDNQLECSCVCEVPDASVLDVIVVDAGDPCNPNRNACPFVIPDYCIDGGLPDPDAGPLTQQECAAICGVSAPSVFCNFSTDANGQPAIDCYAQCVGGRRPAGLARARVARRGSALGRYFAHAAHLEAASIDAFSTLRDELAEHGAPAGLLRACERAQRDEVRHARMTGALARRFGARPATPRARRRGTRTLEQIAVENAVEGCVRETFGAITAMHQARMAADPSVRAVMARIAPDEVNHAALGWAVAAWAERRLDPEARARVAEARRAAARELEEQARAELPRELLTKAGLPSTTRTRRLLDQMNRALWG